MREVQVKIFLQWALWAVCLANAGKPAAVLKNSKSRYGGTTMRACLCAAIALASLGLAAPAFAGDKEAIQSLDDQFSAAGNRGDAGAIAAMYAPGATVLPPDNSVVTGAGIKTLFAGMASQLTNLKLTATEVTRLSPDYIREIGVSSFTTKGDKPANVTGSYVVVWKRVDGAWKLWTDIFH